MKMIKEIIASIPENALLAMVTALGGGTAAGGRLQPDRAFVK